VVEECGEAQAAIGKTLRFGLYSSNPLLPAEKQETNIEWVRRELRDLVAAIERVDVLMRREDVVRERVEADESKG
jgi:cytolysin (calcineurin-like family phosphatase)